MTKTNRKRLKAKASRKKGARKTRSQGEVLEPDEILAPEQDFSPEFLAAQFKPGQSGNPGGRKKGAHSMKTTMERILAEEARTTDGRVMPKMEALCRKILSGSLRADHDPQLMEILTSRLWVKPTALEVTGAVEVNHTARAAVQKMDAKGLEALALALGQMGAVSEMSDAPARDDEKVH